MNYSIKKLQGIDCIFAPMQDSNSITIEIMCKAGNQYETKTTNGISHFLEHLFFKWWKKYTTPKAVAEVVDKFGGEFNAYTGDEYAGYYVKCAPDFVNKAIDVLWDMMINAQFPKEELEREKWVVIQELKMYEDNPMALVSQKRQERYFGDNNYGRPTIWTIENILSFDQDMLFQHKEQLYTKDNLIIIVTGKINNQSEIEEQLTSIFQTLPEKKIIQNHLFQIINQQKNQVFSTKKQNKIIWLYLLMDLKEMTKQDMQQAFSQQFLAEICLLDFFKILEKKKDFVIISSASHLSGQDDGTFMMRAGIDKERFDFGIQRIYEEIEKIAGGDISQEEFDNTIWYNIGQLQMGIESSDQMASFLGAQYLLYGKIETLDEIVQTYKNLKIEDIKAIANKLNKENLYLYYIK
jgi:predicted Zn-dependent peptidase